MSTFVLTQGCPHCALEIYNRLFPSVLCINHRNYHKLSKMFSHTRSFNLHSTDDELSWIITLRRRMMKQFNPSWFSSAQKILNTSAFNLKDEHKNNTNKLINGIFMKQKRTLKTYATRRFDLNGLQVSSKL